MWKTLSDEQIEQAKREVQYQFKSPLHEHNDCIRMAYHWLDAQPRLKTIRLVYPIKSLVERWCGRYVSLSDVEVAAHLHPEIKGQYPYFNISKLLTEPSLERLEGIQQAFKHSNYRERHSFDDYKRREVCGR